MAHRVTHTYALLEVSPAAFEEIQGKLFKAGYGHAFVEDGVIDMNGLALKRGEEPAGNVTGCVGSITSFIGPSDPRECDMQAEILARELKVGAGVADMRVAESSATPDQWMRMAEHLLKKFIIRPRVDVTDGSSPLSSLGEVVQ